VNINRFIAKENERGMKVTANGMITVMDLRVSQRTTNNCKQISNGSTETATYFYSQNIKSETDIIMDT